MLIEIVAYPVNSVLDVLNAMNRSDTFDASNDGFLLMFDLMIYPILSLITQPFAVIHVLTLPQLMF